ncbi:hypothetical protein OROGR_022538 [Orobanche gracilis]
MVDCPEGVLQHPSGIFVNIHPMLAGGGVNFESLGSKIGQISRAAFVGGGGGFWKEAAADGRVALAFTAFAGIALAAAVLYTTR